MDTNNLSTPKIPPIRTYAQDLETNRKVKNLPTGGVLISEQKKDPAPKFVIRKKEEVKKAPTINRVHEEPIVVATPLPPLNTLQSKPDQSKPKPPTKITATELAATKTFNVHGENGSSATVITDTKRDRFKLIPAIISSVSSWFAAQKLAYATKKTPKYTVPETTRRKGVIQKATGVTGKLTTSDFSLIQERIKNRKEWVAPSLSTTTWSANTEPGFLLLEEPLPTEVTNVKIIPKRSFFATPSEVVPIEEIEQPLPETPIIVQPQPETPVTKVVAETVAPDPVDGDHNNTENEETNLEQRSIPSYLRLLLVNTNTLVLVIFGIILFLILIVTYGYFSFTGKEIYINEATGTETPYILETPLKFASGANNERSTLLALLETVRTETTGAFQLAFLFSGSSEDVIPSPILLSILNLRLEDNLTRSISHIRFGYTQNDSPFLIMRVMDETVARGGLLASEEILQQNLLELFSYSNEIKTSRFIDASLSGIDVRVLKTTSGNDLIIYGVINNIVIVAKSSQDFTELKNLIK